MRERQYSFLFRGNRPSTPFAGNTAQDFARSCRKLDLSELVFGTFLADLLNRGPRSGRRTCGRVFRFGHIPTIFEDSRLSCGTPSVSDGNGYIATSASDSASRERLYAGPTLLITSKTLSMFDDLPEISRRKTRRKAEQ